MQANSRIKIFEDKLRAAGVMTRCNWQAKRDAKAKHFDIEHLSFAGDGFAPTVATAIMINYGERDGFGLYVDHDVPNNFDDMVAMIAKPRDLTTPPAKTPYTVILLLPPYLRNDDPLARNGTRQYHVEGERPEDAFGAAQDLLLADLADSCDPAYCASDIAVIAVFEGHLQDQFIP